MARRSDAEKVLFLLYENYPMSNAQIKSRLDISDEKYLSVRNELLGNSYVEKYQCRGGGIKITLKGERFISKKVETAFSSKVEKEAELYEPFLKCLEKEIIENEENAIVLNTSSLRKKGKWSNPDLIKIAYREYPLLRINSISIITYEIKQASKWDNSCVYETASHSIFSNESYVVLEWSKERGFEELENLLLISRRFGVGLITMLPYYANYRFITQSESEVRNPSPELIEDYLNYLFQKYPEYMQKFETLFTSKTITKRGY